MVLWLPQMVIFLMAVTGLPVFSASWEMARLWSRRTMAWNCSGFSLGALARAMRALVFAGLPTTSTFTVRLATSLRASPWGLKMPPFAERRSLRSMPALRGRAPTSSA